MSVSREQTCLGCKKRIDLLEDGFRCLDCPFFFCRACAAYHFGETDVSPVTGRQDINAPLREGVRALHDMVDQTDPNDPIGAALTRARLSRRP